MVNGKVNSMENLAIFHLLMLSLLILKTLMLKVIRMHDFYIELHFDKINIINRNDNVNILIIIISFVYHEYHF